MVSAKRSNGPYFKDIDLTEGQFGVEDLKELSDSVVCRFMNLRMMLNLVLITNYGDKNIRKNRGIHIK